MQVKQIAQLYNNPSIPEEETRVNGWIRTTRASNAFGFIELNDGTCFKNLQIVAEQGALPNFSDVVRYPLGAAIEVVGQLMPTPDRPQPFELHAKQVTLLADCEESYPLQKKRHSVEYLRTIAHLRPRTNLFNAVFRIRSLASYAIHHFFNERGFVYIHTPIITSSDAEGAGEMFRVTTLDAQNPPRDDNGLIDYSKDFFGTMTGLTVSGQLNAEAYALAYQKVYTFGPTFRAENSNTPRHAAEFWMIEPEIAFADLSDDMDLARDMMTFIIRYVLQNAPEEFNFLNSFVEKGLIERLSRLAESPFIRMTYTDAIKELEKSGQDFAFPVHWGMDMQTEHERYLSEKVGHGPVFVTDYPKEIKAFYMRLNDDGKTVAAADLLVPGVGELIGGSQREERYDVLLSRMQELGLAPEEYSWYMDLRRYGGVKHAGYGLGFERLVMYLTGIANIRDSIPFPRTGKPIDF